MANASDTGPGIPYCRTPAGSTGDTTGPDFVEMATGTGTGTGVGGGGLAIVDGNDGKGSFNVGVGFSSSFRGLGISRAVKDAPANADVAAMMAMVALDIGAS